MNLQLHFGPVLVGEIEDPFRSDATGHGVFRPLLQGNDSAVARLWEYIAFSEEWHARVKEEQPHNVAEWDAFRDVFESDLWHTVALDGTVNRIGGPVFVEGEVTWRSI
jgi:hypothetical protein